MKKTTPDLCLLVPDLTSMSILGEKGGFILWKQDLCICAFLHYHSSPVARFAQKVDPKGTARGTRQ